MKILKYKKLSNGKYRVEFDSGNRDFYEEVILKFNLLLKKEIKAKELEEMEQESIFWEGYYFSLKSLKSRYKSCKELARLLASKGYDNDDVIKIVEKLKDQGYLDDRVFAKAYINEQIITSSKGPFRIRKALEEKGVDTKIIDEEINYFTPEMELEKINKVIRIALKSNRNRGGIVLRRKIINDLVKLGYSSTIINKVIDNYDFNDTRDIAKKEYDKLYRQLSKKYNGNELEYKIKEKLYQKGLRYEKE